MLISKAFLLPLVKKIQVIKGLTETKAHETETVTLEVELSQADVEGSWTRDGVRVRSGGNCRITALGKKHSLTLSNLKMEDAGTIVFQAEGVRVSGKLIVTGKISMWSLRNWLTKLSLLCSLLCSNNDCIILPIVLVVQNLQL